MYPLSQGQLHTLSADVCVRVYDFRRLIFPSYRLAVHTLNAPTHPLPGRANEKRLVWLAVADDLFPVWQQAGYGRARWGGRGRKTPCFACHMLPTVAFLNNVFVACIYIINIWKCVCVSVSVCCVCVTCVRSVTTVWMNGMNEWIDSHHQYIIIVHYSILLSIA